MKSAQPSLQALAHIRPALREHLQNMRVHCTRCGVCLKDCAFLKAYGAPGQIAENYDPTAKQWLRIPFACSLCGLCRAVCPQGLAPDSMLREMRMHSVEAGQAPFAEHKGPLQFERMGMSRILTWQGLPDGCTRVLFPGCCFPGSRPGRTKELFNLLRADDPQLGIVLDCCGRISNDLGREAFARGRIERLCTSLLKRGVRQIILICPSCYDMLHGFHPDLTVSMIYEVLPDISARQSLSAQVDLHDPCALRFQTQVHEAVRSRLRSAQIETCELPHARECTLCCGMGAGVKPFAPDMARKWLDLAAGEAHGRMLATYCAGCAGRLGERVTSVHVLDLLCDPQAALNGALRPARGVRAYLNRLLLKGYFWHYMTRGEA